MCRHRSSCNGPLLILLLALLSPPAAWAAQVLLLATTTSTDNTGLLDFLAPRLQKETGIELRWVAVGTGKALELGRNCDVDVLLVHAPEAEKRFISQGYATSRLQVMYNDFVLIGPQDDPAGISGMAPASALARIRERQALFLSRGDNSGTNKKEQALWRQGIGQVPEQAPWYLQTGQGMLTTITMAAEKQAYTLTDRGTWIRYRASRSGDDRLRILVEGDRSLFNQYSVLVIDPQKCPRTKSGPATRFSRWLVSPSTQQLISSFRLLGQPLFIPNAGQTDR